MNILQKKKSVISLGGGSFLNKKVQKEIHNNHTSFWLYWDNRTIIDRIKKSHKRPLAIKSTIDDLNDLIKKRSNIYAKAMYKIDCNGLSKKEIVNKVFETYETN